jgi:hypothetical protein
MAGTENFDELALVVEQTGMAFRHEIGMTNAWQLEGRDDREDEEDYYAKSEEHLIHG